MVSFNPWKKRCTQPLKYFEINNSTVQCHLRLECVALRFATFRFRVTKDRN